MRRERDLLTQRGLASERRLGAEHEAGISLEALVGADQRADVALDRGRVGGRYEPGRDRLALVDDVGHRGRDLRDVGLGGRLAARAAAAGAQRETRREDGGASRAVPATPVYANHVQIVASGLSEW